MDTTSIAKNSNLVIKKIVIKGLRKTKPQIVFRELSFKEGDSIIHLDKELTKTKNLIFNTRLFNKVELSRSNDTIYIDVIERWYTYPLPVLDITDRNFNEWWTLRNRDWSRVNYGIDFTQLNMRGRNEVLKIYLQTGFNKKIEAKYTVPYINKGQTLGISGFVSYILDKQVGYSTEKNYLLFTEIKNNARRRFNASFSLFYRKKLYQTHYWGIGYYRNQVPDTIVKLNPNYFLEGNTLQRFLALQYSFVNDHRDAAFYPLKGYYWATSISKSGILRSDNLNLWSAFFDFAYYKSLHKKWYASFNFSQKISSPVIQPYIYGRGLGYGSSYVSGYELYVIDGQHFSLVKTSLRFKAISFEKSLKFIPIKQFQNIPIQIYLRAFSDGGIAIDRSSNKGNQYLANQFLWGNGIGIDIVSYYDAVFRVDFSINKNMETGIYFHYRSIF